MFGLMRHARAPHIIWIHLICQGHQIPKLIGHAAHTGPSTQRRPCSQPHRFHLAHRHGRSQEARGKRAGAEHRQPACPHGARSQPTRRGKHCSALVLMLHLAFLLLWHTLTRWTGNLSISSIMALALQQQGVKGSHWQGNAVMTGLTNIVFFRHAVDDDDGLGCGVVRSGERRRTKAGPHCGIDADPDTGT